MLHVQNLTKTYSGTVALNRVSLQMNGGEIVGLLGRNGAGKTTCLLCIAGLVRPTSGDVTIDNSSGENPRPQSIALVPELPEVYDDLTVWEHLVFTAMSCGIAEGWQVQARALIRRFQLEEYRDVLGQALSKGNRQKTLLACALLTNPDILLLDEPMIGLDPPGQKVVMDMMNDLRRDGKAIMLSTHTLSVARDVCNRLLILRRGDPVFIGDVSSLPLLTGENMENGFLRMTQ